MTDSIIEQVKDPNRFSRANEHIAKITGERRIMKPTYYRHKKTGDEYCYLAGGIGWPRDPKEKPGFAVVVGVDKPKTPDEKPSMRCLEEAGALTIDGLLTECVRLQKKYGHRECPDLFRIWYGDQERSDTSVNLFNVKTTERHDSVHVVSPYDFEKKNAFERYTNQIWSGLSTAPSTGKKWLYLGECTKLRNYIQNTPLDVAVKGDVKDYPAITALGGLVHTLSLLMPWLKFVKPERTVPTIHDPLTELEDDYERAWWENESDDDQEYDSGELKPTCGY